MTSHPNVKIIKPSRQLPWRVVALTCGLAAFASAFAQSRPPSSVSSETLAKYNKNKNGQLDADERAAMTAEERKAANVPVENTSAVPDKSEVVTLSPFSVDASNDKGYLASNTLSGTRLNSKVEDLASSITVVTKQQMVDTAVLDINDIFLYEANTGSSPSPSIPTASLSPTASSIPASSS